MPTGAIIDFLNSNTQFKKLDKTIIELEFSQCKIKVEMHGDVDATQTEKILTACFNSASKNQKDGAK